MADAVSPLHRLAEAAGIQVRWVDAGGRPQEVSDDSLKMVLDALGYPASSEGEIADGLAQRREEERAPSFFSVDVGKPLRLPDAFGGSGRAELVLEDGSRQVIELEQEAQGWRVPGIAAPGYHRIESGGREARVAVAPPRCFGVSDAAPGKRLWGTAVQIPSLRDAKARPYGDFGSLAEAVRAFAAAGADAAAISPTHALFPADATRFSPYAPSSRLFHNILLGDPTRLGCSLPSPSGELIDWEAAIPARIALLRQAFAGVRDAIAEPLAQFRAKRGSLLERHATYDALHTRFFETGATGWQDWPSEFHDPDGEAVACFRAQNADEIAFFCFAQWLASESLAAAQAAATELGMALGLISDLAVGVEAGGSDGWSRRGELLGRLSIGAPPDLLGPDGQDWGITGFSPFALKRSGFAGFIETIRATLAHAGGVRIDHALGLRRLWVVPHGASSVDGAYLTNPFDDLLRIIAIESHRARGVVIGEDLGTVPEGLRPALEARQILGMRVLWFERDEDGFIPPERWQHDAAAMTTTHDLPTVAGWWRGRDIELTWQLGRSSSASSEADHRAERDEERTELWSAFRESGAAQGPRPAEDDPAPVVDAAVLHVGRTGCEIRIVALEDIFGLVEQPNLPGTIDEHPNWRRRMPGPTADILARPDVSRRLRALDESRK